MDGGSRAVEVELGNRYASKDNSDDALFVWLCMYVHVYVYIYTYTNNYIIVS